MVSVQIDRTECWLEFARTHARLLNLMSFSVYSCRTSKILTFIESLFRTLLTDNCLVARYEPGKEPSVSVCHNYNFDLVNNRSRTQDVPRILTRSCTFPSCESDNPCRKLLHQGVSVECRQRYYIHSR